MSDRLEALLEAAQAAEHPSPKIADATWVRIDARAQAGAGPSVPVDVRGVPGFARGTAPLLAKIALVTAVVGAIGIGVLRADRGAPSQLHGGALTGLSAPILEQPEPTKPKVAADPPRAPQPPPEVPAATPTPAAEPRTPARPKPQPKAKPSASRLSEETALLRKAWRALDQGRSVQAATVIATHERTFPKGALIEEREAVRAVLGCQRDAQTGDSIAARFSTRFPTSVHRARVRRACLEEEK